jgi:2-polyprenyl-6-methoxyphenol hydroxylase-like FAD-dependent oxidoreductase
VPASRTVVVAGAGIGGLTAALALAGKGFRVALFEAAERLEEVGAGIQLSPNAARVLISLGLGERLAPHLVIPEELVVKIARTGQVLARAPLGASAGQRYGAPYWVIHRGDLQGVLRDAAASMPDITLHLGTKVDEFAAHDGGITIAASHRMDAVEERGILLICADGLWSRLRKRLGHGGEPKFAGHTAWRALIPARAVPAEFTRPAVNLWLGRNAHLVHYPVKGGALINVVAILRDTWNEPGWSAAGLRRDVLDRFPAELWQAPARELLRGSQNWQKWALFDCPPLSHWGKGPVTLLGDAAHPMLPYLAQGAAMAIEDAAVIAECLARTPDDPAGAARAYEKQRHRRTARTQRAARRNGTIYHLGGAEAALRVLAFLTMGGDKLIRRYDWLYGWQA